MKMRITRNFCILAALIPASILIQQYMVSRHRRTIVNSEDDIRTTVAPDALRPNTDGDFIDDDDLDHLDGTNTMDDTPMDFDDREDDNNDDDIEPFKLPENPDDTEMHLDNEDDGNDIEQMGQDEPQHTHTQPDGEEDVENEDLQPQDLEDDEDFRLHIKTQQENTDTQTLDDTKVPEKDPHRFGDMTDKDNTFITVVPPPIEVPVTDLEEDLNALLAEDEVEKYEEDESWMWETSGQEDPCKRCLAPVQSRPIVALASAPGTGNTWTRHLLEQATGIYTGSVYHDRRLFYGGFHGEYMDYTYKNMLIVKTHARGELAAEDFEKAIVLIRNPFDMIITELHRVYSANHSVINTADDIFKHSDWTDHVYHRLDWWEGVPDIWLSSGKPIMVVNYEDILASPEAQIKRMVEYLGLTMDASRQNCLKTGIESRLPISDKEFKDELRMSIFHGFTSEMKTKIHERLITLSNRLKKHGHPEVVIKHEFK